MLFLDLPDVALGEVLLYLPLEELYAGVMRTCSKLHFFITENPGFIGSLSDSYLSFEIDLSFSRSAMLSDLSRSQTSLLQLRGYYTNGGVMRSWGRFCFHNMFEYSGAVYSTHQRAKEVLTKAYFTGSFGTDFFDMRTNEDLEWRWRGRGTPMRYVENEVMNRCGNDRNGKYLPGFNFLCRTEMRDHADMSQNVIEEEVPELTKAAVVTRVAVCRPGLSTSPVRTLLLYSGLQSNSWDSHVSGQTSNPQELLSSFPSTILITEKSHQYIEFSDSTAPWIWVQFLDPGSSMVVIDLARPRCLTHLSVLMLDRDDRREDYHMYFKTMDIGYVALFGKIVRVA